MSNFNHSNIQLSKITNTEILCGHTMTGKCITLEKMYISDPRCEGGALLFFLPMSFVNIYHSTYATGLYLNIQAENLL